MAKLQIKKSNETGKVPQPSDLDWGELAINYADGKLFYKKHYADPQITPTVEQITGASGVTSVALTVPTGLSVSGSPITGSGTFAVTFANGYSIPTTASQTNWDTAYTDRLKWDGGSSGLVAATGRTSLGATTVGSNLFTLTNPSAVTFLRVNADNTVTARTAAEFSGDIGATSANTASTIVARDASGNFSAGTISANVVTVTGSSSSGYISTLSVDSWKYSGNTLSVSGQETEPRDLFFNNTGTILFLLGNAGDDITSYTLSTPWNITTATAGTTFSLAGQDTTPTGFYFKPDGLTFYVLGNTNDTVYRYDMSSAWDISTAVFSNSFSVTAQETGPQAISFSSDGSIMYILGSTDDDITWYNLSTPWNITTAVHVSQFSVSVYEPSPEGMYFSSDGTSLWVSGTNTRTILYYTLSTPWNLNTATFIERVSVAFLTTDGLTRFAVYPSGIYVNPSLNKAWITDYNSDRIFELDTNTPAQKFTGSKVVVNNDLNVTRNFSVLGDIYIRGNLDSVSQAVFASQVLSPTFNTSGSSTSTFSVGTNISAGAFNLGTGLTTGAFTLGGTGTTGLMTIGRSTATHTLDIDSGATISGSTKTVNIGSGGVAGSTTNINLGSSTSNTSVVISTASGGTATVGLRLVNGSYTVNTLARTNAGSYNPVVQADDSLIYFTAGTQGTGALVIAPWSTTSAGIRISNTSVTIPANTASTSTTTGALVVTGGVGISGNLNVAQKITGLLATGELLALGDITNATDKYISIKSLYGSMEIGRNGNINAYMNSNMAVGTLDLIHNAVKIQIRADDTVVIPQTTASTSTTTGALVVTGGAGFGGTVYANEFVGTFTDSTTFFQDNANNAKKMQLQLSSIIAGSGATVTYTVTSGGISSITAIPNGGTNYKVGDILTINGYTNTARLTVSTVTALGAITAFTITTAGTGYSAGTAATTTLLSTIREYTIPVESTTLVGIDTVQTLSNKYLMDDSVILQNSTDTTKKAYFSLLGITAGSTRIITLPDASTTLVGRTTTDTLTNKTFTDSTTFFQDNSDNSKKLQFELNSIATSTTRTLTIPDASGTIALASTTIAGYGITDAYTKTEVDGFLQGLDPKASVRVATTANITLSGAQTIDGIAVVAGDRVLVKDQTAAQQNGIYVAAAAAWARAADMNTWAEVPGSYVFTEEGTTQADFGYVCTSGAGGTLDTTAITWVQFNGAANITAGTGLTKSGNTLSVSTVPLANGGTGATTAAAARTNLGANTVGSNLFTLTNPSAVTFLRVNADNTVTARTAAEFRGDIGAGTVTSVGGTGTVSGLTLTGTVTGSGNLTLGGAITGFLPTTGGTVTGAITVNTGATGVIATFEGPTGRYIYTGTDGTGHYIEQTGTTAAERVLRIQGNNGSGTYTQFFIDSANQRIYTSSNVNVGIGTTAPGAKLEVNGNIITTRTDGGAYIINRGSYSASTVYAFWNNDNTGISNPAAGELGFVSSNAERIRINTSGNVGIATTTPAVNLSVAGTLGVSESGSTGARLRITSTGSGAEIFQNDNSDIIFKTQTATQEKVRFKDNGNVGIGTSTPGYKLEVNGSFAATTKSFVIPHPTKSGKKLRYGSLEGPENGVYVRGRLCGTKIELPDYWTKLVDPDSITVTLTPIGTHQKLYVKDVSNNIITVGNENLLDKTINCYYVVYAERCDVEKLEVEINVN